MLEIQKNSRQVPSTKKVCSNKLYCDTLYAYLQCISYWDQDKKIRYVLKKQLNFSIMADQFNVSRQTLSKKLGQLIEIGLIIYDKEEKTYILQTLPNKEAYLIPMQTLNQLSCAFNERSISVYVYLFNRFIMNNYKPYEFTLEQVKTWVGISTKTRSNDEIITNILKVLYTCGLIEYRMIDKIDNTTNFGNIKTMFQLVGVSNELKTKEVQRIKVKDKKVIES